MDFSEWKRRECAQCTRKLRARLRAPNQIRGDACNFPYPDLTMKNASYRNECSFEDMRNNAAKNY
jgi:hypothetical protein